MLLIEDDDVVIERIPIPWTGWKAFELCAGRRNVDPRSWLTVILGDGISRGVTIREMCAWLFPARGSRRHARNPTLRLDAAGVSCGGRAMITHAIVHLKRPDGKFQGSISFTRNEWLALRRTIRGQSPCAPFNRALNRLVPRKARGLTKPSIQQSPVLVRLGGAFAAPSSAGNQLLSNNIMGSLPNMSPCFASSLSFPKRFSSGVE